MKNANLRWLVPVMAGLVVLRGWDLWKASRPDGPKASPELSGPVAASARPSTTMATSEPAPGPTVSIGAATPTALQRGATATEEVAPNVFAPRLPPVPAAPPAPVSTPAPPPFVGPPIPPPPPPPLPPPALQVIGTWLDDKGLSVFVSDTTTTAQARSGDLLFGQYRVTELSAERLLIYDTARKSDFSYPVPRVDSRMNPPPHP